MDRVYPSLGTSACRWWDGYSKWYSRGRKSRTAQLRHSPWRERLGAGHGSRASIPHSRRDRHGGGQDEADLARDLHDSRRVRHLDHDDEQAPIPFDVRYGSDRRDDDRNDCAACACDEHPRASWIR